MLGTASTAQANPSLYLADTGAADSAGLKVVATEDTEYENIRVVELASGLEHPWSMAFLPDGQILVTERPGRLNLVDNGQVTEVSGVPEVNAERQGGLLDVAVHPNFETTGWVYLTYSKANGNGETATALARGRLDGSALVDVEDLFVQNRYSEPGQHYGSRLAWTPDGKLLMTIGDRWHEPLRSQDLNDHAGKLLRLNDDGSAPEDNPFVNNPEALDEIYAYGLRNVQSLLASPTTGEIWVADHGPRGGDELNRIEAGNNYGWPLVTRGYDYATEAPVEEAIGRRPEDVDVEVVSPFYEFLPTHAPSGITLVTANQFPAWQGNLLVGGLRSERLRRVVFDEREVLHEEELLLQKVGRIRDVREGPDGFIYVLQDNEDGGLYRVEPVAE
ncbi:MAG: PQQ-dependent sugar dehydrogenase [Cyanobacteria bacterium Co-bin13]|nr:PQQ-dependent sugar dehydrogenase [Cyanobacteria bacterium Co-bin13]